MNIILLQIIFTSVWFSCSALIDFVAIPTVFRVVKTVPDGILIGGQIGALVFKQFNFLEVLLGLCILAGTLYKCDFKKNLNKIKIFLSVLILSIAFLYTFYLSPGITSSHLLIINPDILNSVLEKAQENLDFFHKSYVAVEKVKVTALLILLVIQLMSFKSEAKI